VRGVPQVANVVVRQADRPYDPSAGQKYETTGNQARHIPINISAPCRRDLGVAESGISTRSDSHEARLRLNRSDWRSQATVLAEEAGLRLQAVKHGISDNARSVLEYYTRLRTVRLRVLWMKGGLERIEAGRRQISVHAERLRGSKDVMGPRAMERRRDGRLERRGTRGRGSALGTYRPR